jgi:hypothetical protein
MEEETICLFWAPVMRAPLVRGFAAGVTYAQTWPRLAHLEGIRPDEREG